MIKVIQFLKDNSIAYIATSSDNIPTVRVMQILDIDAKKILFNTKKFKQSYKDLCQNPNIEICFYNSKTYEQIRVYGQAKEIDSIELKKQIIKDYPQLEPLVEKEGIEVIKPFQINNWKYKTAKRH